MPQVNAPTFDAKRAWKDVIVHVSRELSTTKPKTVQRYMPRWWDESMLETRGDYLEALLMLASGLQVPAERLEKQMSPLIPSDVLTRCKGSSQEKDRLHLAARQAAEALARNLVALLPSSSSPDSLSALELRHRVLAKHECIGLKGLLATCWDIGVPVAHLHDSPTPKPDAIATNVDGRCAIVLLRNKRHSGWLLFDLAHEIGHILLGHLHPGESFCDDDDLGPDEGVEAEANEFATVLLTGQPIPLGYSKVVPADKLTRVAKEAALELKVDPQWLIVTTGNRWGTQVGWMTISKALKEGWPNDDACGLVQAELERRLRSLEAGTSRQDAILSLTTAP